MCPTMCLYFASTVNLKKPTQNQNKQQPPTASNQAKNQMQPF